MRHAVAWGLLVSVLLAGCGKPERNPVPPAGAKGDDDRPRPEDVVEVNAEKDGPLKVGPALVSVKRAWETKYEGAATLTIAIRVECPKDDASFVIKGFAADVPLVEKLTGKAADPKSFTKPLPVNFSLTADGKDKCRGLQRVLTSDPEGSAPKIGAQATEAKASPGSVHYMLYEVERPGREVKELSLDIAADDIGHNGRVRFRIPAAKVVRE